MRPLALFSEQKFHSWTQKCSHDFGKRKVEKQHLHLDSYPVYVLNPARSIPVLASGFFMNVSQTKLVRAFSAISIVIPVSIPTTSWSNQFFRGLKAFVKPYLFQAAP